MTSINHQQTKHSISCRAVIRGSLNHPLNGLDLCCAFHGLLSLLERRGGMAPWWPARTRSSPVPAAWSTARVQSLCQGCSAWAKEDEQQQGYSWSCLYLCNGLFRLTQVCGVKRCHSGSVNSCSYCTEVAQKSGKSWVCFDWKNEF